MHISLIDKKLLALASCYGVRGIIYFGTCYYWKIINLVMYNTNPLLIFL